MKNRKQIEARRRQKTAARAKRDKAYNPHLKRLVRLAPNTPPAQPGPMEDVASRWFVLHGLNYLASDYANGVWSPLVDIYSEDLRPDQVPTLQDVFVQVADKQFDDQTQNWTPLGKLLAAWLMVPPETMRGIRMALLEHIAQQDTVEQVAEQVVKPHNPAVWAFFHDQIISRLAQPDADDTANTPVAPDPEG